MMKRAVGVRSERELWAWLPPPKRKRLVFLLGRLLERRLKPEEAGGDRDAPRR